ATPQELYWRLTTSTPRRIEGVRSNSGRAMSDYFSDRELGPRPRVEQQISLGVWRARDLLVQRRIDDGSFGFGFPEMCPDGRGPCGSSPRDFWTTAEAEIPGVNAIRGSQKHRWLAQDVPPVLVILD